MAQPFVAEQERTALPDGLYRVETPQFCAGFVVEAGRITSCAPILRRKLGHWKRLATPVLRPPDPGQMNYG